MSVEYKGKQRRVKSYKDGTFLLDLSFKKIVDIFDIVGLIQLKELTILDLSYNQITEIKGLENLTNLKSLDLSYNQISEIKNLEFLSHLQSLKLQNNQITEIKSLEKLTNLKFLDLMHNQIRELKGLETLKNLKFFSVYANPVYDWIKKELGGDYRKAELVVQYCSMQKGLYQANPDEIKNYLHVIKEEIEVFITKKSYYEVVKLLLDAYAKVRLVDKTLFYDFFGNLLREHPNLYNKKFFRNYSYIVQNLASKEVIEMESYVIDNFCTIKGEKLKLFFRGSLDFEKLILKGRLYFTNFRVFVFGSLDHRSSNMLFEITRQKRELLRIMQKGLRGFQGVPRFGYQLPLYKARVLSIRRKFMRIKSFKYRIKIQPLKYTNEGKQEYLDRAGNIFSNIQELVLKSEL